MAFVKPGSGNQIVQEGVEGGGSSTGSGITSGSGSTSGGTVDQDQNITQYPKPRWVPKDDTVQSVFIYNDDQTKLITLSGAWYRRRTLDTPYKLTYWDNTSHKFITVDCPYLYEIWTDPKGGSINKDSSTILGYYTSSSSSSNVIGTYISQYSDADTIAKFFVRHRIDFSTSTRDNIPLFAGISVGLGEHTVDPGYGQPT